MTSSIIPRRVLYKPDDGYFGDANPIYADGRYHIFYIFCASDDVDQLNGVWRGLDWAHIVTDDFATFEELPMALYRGRPEERDPLAGAGCVVQRGPDDYVMFYGGINPDPPPGRPEQVVLRAVSSDLVTWTKDPKWEIRTTPEHYLPDCFRDPFVWQDADSGEWRMIFAGQVPLTSGPEHRRGAVGYATSSDLETWEFHPPLFNPGTTLTPECPEYFTHNGRHYLVYSSYSERFATRYRVADQFGGPWQIPEHDAFDSNDVYAAKTVTDGQRRFYVGWLATRGMDRDLGHRQWGGHLVAHELTSRADGTWATSPVPEFLRRFETQDVRPCPRIGEWDLDSTSASFDGPGFGWCSLGRLDDTCLLDVTIDAGYTAEEVGIGLRTSSDFQKALLIRLEPQHGRVVFDRRPHKIVIPFDPDGDREYVSAADFEIERPLRIDESGRVRIQVVLDGSSIVAYINDVALSTRGYGQPAGEWGIYAAGVHTPVTFRDFRFGVARSRLGV
ncbi:glycoside hydrolase family 32 protein [Phytohabitans sp. ZYX-F-186]|uniref:beta-fructofuranosidase n=1 Tax=Phytohabitans maris TaxID=3071409 RepID=A0ABU0ZKG0_9ACTN|nr:glycoside hydrolase family 32 protein [Phytohabitans sp. ZYX-F-186]MDQ7907541.1 glycoside hydrolase family 32 protein [Phytohabitans sp. ZYX-F-186]